MPSPRFLIPQGTLDMPVLQILSLEPAYGYGIAQRLEQISRAVEKDSWARLSGAQNLIFVEGSR